MIISLQRKSRHERDFLLPLTNFTQCQETIFFTRYFSVLSAAIISCKKKITFALLSLETKVKSIYE